MRYDENIRFLSAYYCYETDKGTILMITNPECEEDGDGYVIAEYGLDNSNELECVSTMFDVDSWDQIEAEYNITKFTGIATSEDGVFEYLLEDIEENEEDEEEEDYDMNTTKIQEDIDRLFEILDDYADDINPEVEEAFDEALFIARQLCAEVERLQEMVNQ